MPKQTGIHLIFLPPNTSFYLQISHRFTSKHNVCNTVYGSRCFAIVKTVTRSCNMYIHCFLVNLTLSFEYFPRFFELIYRSFRSSKNRAWTVLLLLLLLLLLVIPISINITFVIICTSWIDGPKNDVSSFFARKFFSKTNLLVTYTHVYFYLFSKNLWKSNWSIKLNWRLNWKQFFHSIWGAIMHL